MLCYTEATRPELKDLYKHVIRRYAAYWKEIGILLGVDANTLDIIKLDNLEDTKKRCLSMFEKWLEIDASASWEKFFEAFDLTIKSEVSASK